MKAPAGAPALALQGIGHAFAGTAALHDVSVAFAPARIHALLGENGAGKSTLVRVAAGLLRPDRGEVRVDGRARVLATPRQARDAGIGMVHQEFALVAALSVAENLFLGEVRGWLSRRGLARRARQVMEELELPLPPLARVEELATGAKQRLAILKALHHARRVLLLDEPTSALTPDETAQLFGRLRSLRDRGLAIVLITHKLGEVLAVAQDVTVLRRGRVVLHGAVGQHDAATLARAIVGADFTPAPSAPSAPPAAPAAAPGAEHLRARGLAGAGFGPLDLSVRAGEIVAVAGVDGNGQTELVETLVGLRAARQGTLQRAARHGFISGDRLGTSLVPQLAAAENVLLLRHWLPRRWLPRRAVLRSAQPLLERFGVRPAGPWQPVATLSGGNQQRVVLARELCAGPQLIVAQNPTAGLDVGATRFVHEQLRAAATAGAGVLLVSTDLDEVLALAERVLVADRGRLLPAPRERAAIGACMAGLREPAA